MGMIETSIRRPVSVMVAVLLVVIFGLVGLMRVPVQLTPNVDQPVITVTTRWFGASPQEVEQEVVQEQEEVLKTVSGLREMRSSSVEGQATVTMKFKVGVDKDAALNEVRDKLRQVPEYPPDVDEPIAESVDSNSDNYIAWMIVRPLDGKQESLRPMPPTEFGAGGITFDGDVRKLEDWLEDEVKPVLERVNGIAEINVLGGREREMQVRVDFQKLAARGISISDLTAALRRENLSITAGTVKEGKRDTSIRAVGQYEHPEQILNTVITYTQTGDPVYIRDVADVEMGYKKQIAFVRSRGIDVVAINAKRDVGSNIIKVMAGLKEAIGDVNQNVLAPRGWGLELFQVYDESLYVEQSIDNVRSDLLMGSLLSVIVLFVTLRSIGATLVVAISIPISIIGTFLGMALTGRNLNVISMAGLSFAIGMGVDNTIVVLENIFRHREMGKGQFEAAVEGAREVWGAIVAATLANMAVFLPVVFIEEEAGQLFRDIAIAISISLFLYMVVSPTVIPMLATVFLRHIPSSFKEGRETGGEKTRLGRLTSPLARGGEWVSEEFYKVVHWLTGGVVRRLALVVGFIVLALLGSWWLMPPTTYLPTGNQNFVFSMLFPPPGYNLDEYLQMAHRTEGQLRPWWETKEGSPEHKQLQEQWRKITQERAVPGMEGMIAGMQQQLDGLKAAPVQAQPGQSDEQAKVARERAISGLEGTIKTFQGRVDEIKAAYPPTIDNFFFVAFSGRLFMGGTSNDPQNVRALSTLFNGTIQGIPGTFGFATQVPIFRLGEMGSGKSIDLSLSSDNYDKVRQAAGMVQGMMMGEFGGFVQATPSNFNIGRTETQVIPDRLRAAAAGVNAATIRDMTAIAVDGQIIGDYRDAGEVIDLTVISGNLQDSADELRNLPIASAHGVVPLASVASFEHIAAPQQIDRLERTPTISLSVQLPPGMTIEEARDVVENRIVGRLAEQGMLQGIKTGFTGSADKLSSFRSAFLPNFGSLKEFVQGVPGGVFGLAAIITYLLLAALFESWLHPFVIIMSVPLALVGGFAGLWILNKSDPTYQLDVLTMLGFLILIGTIVNNPILIVHQALNYMRQDGMPRRKAIALSTQTRVRPIFMSVVTSVAGMLPLVLGGAAGSELYRGLGAVVVGGLIVSTVFTLLLTPTLMSLMMDMQSSLGGLFRGRSGGRGSPTPVEAPPILPAREPELVNARIVGS